MDNRWTPDYESRNWVADNYYPTSAEDLSRALTAHFSSGDHVFPR